MAIKLTYLVVISMNAVLLAAQMDPNESWDLSISDSSSSNRVPEEASSSRNRVTVGAVEPPQSRTPDIHDLKSVKIQLKDEVSAINVPKDRRYTALYRLYSNWLIKTLSSPDPNVEVYNYLKNVYHAAMKKNQFDNGLADKLLAQVIMNSGIKRPEIVTDLIRQGARWQRLTWLFADLLSLAIKKRDANLLRYLVEELKIPFSNMGNMTLAIILDSNPFSRLSMPGFWKTMEYLISKAGDHLHFPLPDHSRTATHDPGSIAIPSELIGTPAYDLLLGHKLPADTIRHVKSLTTPLEEFPPELQHMRRRLVVDEAPSTNCLTEVLLKYRGTDTLTQEEQTAYESSVSKALERDFQQNAINHYEETNLVNLLTDNMVTETDAVFTKKLLSQLLSKSSDHDRLIRVIDNIFQGKDTPLPYYNIRARNQFEQVALKTRSEIVSYFVTQKELKSLKTRIIDELSDKDKAPCVDGPNCFITKEEYNQFFKINKNIYGQIEKIINVDKFMEIANGTEISDRVKYKKLINMAKHLIKNEGAKLVGNQTTAAAAKKILPDELLADHGQQESIESNSNVDRPAHMESFEIPHTAVKIPINNFPYEPILPPRMPFMQPMPPPIRID